MGVLIGLVFALANDAEAGASYVKGVKLLEEKKFDEAVQALEAAVKFQRQESPAMRYRDDEGRYRHAYYPNFLLGRARLGQAQGEASLDIRLDRLENSLAYLKRSTHPEAKPTEAVVEAAIEKAKKDIEDRNLNTPPQEILDVRAKINGLCDLEKFEEAYKELQAVDKSFAGYHARLKPPILALITTRQDAVLKRYDVVMLGRLEGISRSDPTLEAETIIPQLRPACVPPEVKRDPAARFKWLLGFFSFYEKEVDVVREATTLPVDTVLKSTASFDFAADQAIGVDVFPGYRAARNMAHYIRRARLDEWVAKGDPAQPEYLSTGEKILAASAEMRKKTEADLRQRIEQAANTPLALEMQKYLDTDVLKYQVVQLERLNGTMKDRIKKHNEKVAAEGSLRRAQDGMAARAAMADPLACRRVELDLSALESQDHFQDLPAPIRAQVYYSRALSNATAAFLESEELARVADRCRGDVTRAFALDPKVDAARRGQVSPRILKVFDDILKQKK